MNDIQTKQAEIVQKRRQRMIDGAKRYAAANKSDPFALGRCMAHINSGVASYYRDGLKSDDDRPGYYDANEKTEGRKTTRADGTTLEWKATIHRDVAQP